MAERRLDVRLVPILLQESVLPMTAYKLDRLAGMVRDLLERLAG